MKMVKNKLWGLIICVLELLVGILLLINPVGFTTGIITAVGIVIAVGGILNVVKYFTSSNKKAMNGQYLSKGLISLLAGGFCVLKSSWFIVTFPALTIIYGVMILVMGINNIQLSFDMIREKQKNWFIAAINALISIICAAVILTDPFSSTAALWSFTGITVIIEAVMDFATIFVNKAEETED